MLQATELSDYCCCTYFVLTTAAFRLRVVRVICLVLSYYWQTAQHTRHVCAQCVANNNARLAEANEQLLSYSCVCKEAPKATNKNMNWHQRNGRVSRYDSARKHAADVQRWQPFKYSGGFL
eukprot:7662-Heterococcus_DN1.PRE.1